MQMIEEAYAIISKYSKLKPWRPGMIDVYVYDVMVGMHENDYTEDTVEYIWHKTPDEVMEFLIEDTRIFDLEYGWEQFDEEIREYLIENNLTLIGRKRIIEDDSEEQSEPTKDDMKGTEKQMKGLDKDKKELAQLQAKAKDIIFKYTEDTPQGRKVKGSISDYKKAIGNIPDKIKQLKKKIDSIEKPTTDDEEEQD